MNPARLLFILPILFLASCAGDGGSSSTSTAASEPSGARQRSLDDWANDISKDNGFRVDEAGNYVPRSNKRSSFDRNRNSPYFKEGYSKKEYSGTKSYEKKSWWGDSEYAKKSYDGNTDGSRFQTESRFQGQGARETGSAAGNLPGDYKTGSYKTGSARESAQNGIGKPSDAETDVRRRVFSQPTITNYRQQRNMSVQETKGILGR